MYLQRLEDDIPSHRFRETNAVGTSVSHSHSKSLNRRIASEKPTLLAQERKRRTLRAGRSHRFRETNAVGTRSGTTKRARRSVASLPRNQRCWHKNSLRLRIGRSPSRIASEKPTLLARPPGRNDTARARSHRFRETNAVGTSSACSTSWATQSHRFRETNAVGTGLSSICLTKGAPRRIASEKPTLLARKRRELRRGGVPVASLPRNQRCWHQEDGEGCAVVKWSHRFRETNAVGTAGRACAAPCRLVASLPRNQRCWHILPQPNRPHRQVASLPRNQRCWHPATSPSKMPWMLSHRFRETNAVGTIIPYVSNAAGRVASLPRDQRCWHVS